MKGQDKTPEKQLNEVEMDNLPENEIRIMIVKMIQDLRNRMEIMQEMFTKYLEEIKNKQTKINNTLEGIVSSDFHHSVFRVPCPFFCLSYSANDSF